MYINVCTHTGYEHVSPVLSVINDRGKSLCILFFMCVSVCILKIIKLEVLTFFILTVQLDVTKVTGKHRKRERRWG